MSTYLPKSTSFVPAGTDLGVKLLRSLRPKILYVLISNTAFYVGMLSPASGHAVLRQGDGGVSLYVQNYPISLEIQP